MQDSDKTKALNWLRQRALDGACPICGATFRTPTGEPNMGLYRDYLFMQNVTDVGGKWIPQPNGKFFVCLICNNCGYTMPFDAHKMGLVESRG
jgi:hypothetical protein